MAGLKSWIVAARLRTLPLAFAGWLVGTTLASNVVVVDYTIAGLTLLTAFLLQILSNFANDYGDAVSGVDSDERKGPSRMVQTGAITKKSMGKAMVVFAGLCLLSGCYLLYLAFPNDYVNALIFLIIGLLGIAAAIKYTVGKNPYGYAGFGDFFVFLFFGLVLVFGTYFLQTGTLDWYILLPATSIGLFSIGVLNVNNIRDIESDKRSGKNSIPVRIGRKNAVIYHSFLLWGGMLCSIGYVLVDYRSWFQFLFILIVFIFIKNLKAVREKPLETLDPHLKQMAISTLLFAILFTIGNSFQV